MSDAARAQRSPGFFGGVSVAGLLSAAIAAIAYVGYRGAALPFPPYDLFDWTSRRLPGPLVTFGIDTMVSLIRALRLGATSTVAKMAEQTTAIAAFLVAGALAGGLVFRILRRAESPGTRRRIAVVAGLCAWRST